MLEVYNHQGQRVFSNYATLETHTSTFSYTIPQDSAEGEYQIRVLSPVVPETLKTIKVVRPDLFKVNVEVEYSIYNPSQTVTGRVYVSGIDLSMTSRPVFDLSVNFGNSRVTQVN